MPDSRRAHLQKIRQAHARRSLARQLQNPADEKPTIRRWAVILEVNIDPLDVPATLTIDLGETTVAGVHFLEGFIPAVGDTVAVDVTNNDPLVIGRLHEGQTLVPADGTGGDGGSAGAFGMASGHYYGPWGSSTGAGVAQYTAVPQGVVVCSPLYIGASPTFDLIGIEQTLPPPPIANSRVFLGVYSDLRGKPNTLVVNAGSYNPTSTSGFATLPINQQLKSGLWWLAILVNEISHIQFRSVPAVSAPPFLPLRPDLNLVGGWQRTVTDPMAGLPDPFGTATLYSNNGPRILMRVA